MDKQFILEEIRRCAESNGGAPVGRERFRDLTGIRDSSWEGRYWARWNDAVAEAGLPPNKLKTADYTEAELVHQLALLTRKLGRYPVGAERTLHKRTHPAFPNEKVFSTRLGNRDEQVLLLSALADSTPGFGDVRAIIAPLVDAASAASHPSGDTASAGFVYLARFGRFHKIGRANHVGRRSYELALRLPEKLTLIHAFETDDPVGIERYWHDRYAMKRANGEWFLLSSADVAAFKQRRKFM